MEKWRIMGSRRFVEVFGVEAFRRLGVQDPLFEEELKLERVNAARSSSTGAKERILKLSQKSRGGKKRRPNSDGTLTDGDNSGSTDSSGSETDNRPLAALSLRPSTDEEAVKVISDDTKKSASEADDDSTPTIVATLCDVAEPEIAVTPRPPFRTRALGQRIRQFVGARQHGMLLLLEEQDWASLLNTATLLHQHMVRQVEQALMAVEGLERSAAWRVYGSFPDAVFRVDRKRLGNQRERAAFNCVRHLPADILCNSTG